MPVVSALHGQRGQTVPFWVLSILATLTLAFFILNYANTVRWQVRAQNAADSAAAAALGGDAARLNSVEMLLAAFDIQQLRVRDVIGAIPELIGANACKDYIISSGCVDQISAGTGDVLSSIQRLQKVQSSLTTFSTATLTDTLNNPNATIQTFFKPLESGSGCAINLLTDCDFTYTTRVVMGSNGMPTVDEYACKKIPTFLAGLLRLSGSQASFYAIGHAAQTLAPMRQSLNPSTLGSSLQTSSKLYPDVGSDTEMGSLYGLNVGALVYTPGATTPPASLPAESAAGICPP